MRYKVDSARQCAGCAGTEAHRVVDVKTGRVVAIFRRRDLAEDLCGQLNCPPLAPYPVAAARLEMELVAA